MNHPELHLKQLGLTDAEITVYLRMVAGAQRVQDILKTTKMKRPTIYYALNSLEKRGLVSKTGNNFVFKLAPFERLVAIAREKEDEAVALTEHVAELIPSLAKNGAAKIERPAVSFFEGIDAVKHVVMDVMYAKSHRVDLIVPKETFFWGFGEAFLRKYIEERRSRNIRTRNLWEAEIDPNEFKKYYSTFSETRLLPEIMKGRFETTIFLFDDQTLYVSSYKNGYAILVTSKEHAETIGALFEGLWSVATAYPVDA